MRLGVPKSLNAPENDGMLIGEEGEWSGRSYDSDYAPISTVKVLGA